MALLLIGNLAKNRSGLRLRKITDIKYFIGTGIVSIIFLSWTYAKAINLSSAGVAATLLYTAPAIVMVFSIFLFGERLTLRKIGILLMTLIGCLFVTGALDSRGAVSKEGILFGLCAGFTYAMYSIFTTYALRKYSAVTITFFTFLMASVFLTPFAAGVFVKVFEHDMFLFSMVFALITTVLPFTMYTGGLSKIETSKASLMASVEPVSAAVIGIVFYNESVSAVKLIGIALVAVAVVMAGRK